MLFSIHHKVETGSTNADALQAVEAGAAKQGDVFTADCQTAGRGRQGRVWQSPAGNLCMSLVLMPKRAQSEWGTLSLLAGLAVAKAIKTFLPVTAEVELKWPNDLLIHGKKACGILVEIATTPSGQGAAIIGIGLNCKHHPENVLYPTTDLKAEGARAVEPATILPDILNAFDGFYAQWEITGFAPLLPHWLALSHNLGLSQRLRLSETQEINGTFCGIGVDGALLLDMQDGTRRAFHAGDVVL